MIQYSGRFALTNARTGSVWCGLWDRCINGASMLSPSWALDTLGHSTILTYVEPIFVCLAPFGLIPRAFLSVCCQLTSVGEVGAVECQLSALGPRF